MAVCTSEQNPLLLGASSLIFEISSLSYFNTKVIYEISSIDYFKTEGKYEINSKSNEVLLKQVNRVL